MNDEDLIALYYRDGLDAAALDALEQAVAQDASLQARFDALAAELDGIERDVPAAVPDLTRRRWHAAVVLAARQADAPPQSTPQPSRAAEASSRAWPVALAAALLLGAALGLSVGLRVDEAPAPGAPSVATLEERRPIVERGFAAHLRESRTTLTSLNAAGPDERSALLAALIEQNRLQQRVAENAEAADLARLLRAFELVLHELASEEADGGQRERLGSRLDFEFSTTLQRLERAPLRSGAASAPTPL